MREIYCYHCGRDNVLESETQKGMCVDCAEALAARKTSLANAEDVNWQERAAEAGLAIYERLPDEPLYDYEVVKCYLSLYPVERPTYKKVAEMLGISPSTVSIVAKRVHLEERFKAWVRDCDKEILAKRRQEMVDMNLQHIEMAAAMRDKMQAAIANLNPLDLSPNEIISMTKLARELEKDARLDAASQEELRSEVLTSSSTASPTQAGTRVVDKQDMSEVLSILLASGALKDKTVGVRTTQEVVVKDDTGRSE